MIKSQKSEEKQTHHSSGKKKVAVNRRSLEMRSARTKKWAASLKKRLCKTVAGNMHDAKVYSK